MAQTEKNLSEEATKNRTQLSEQISEAEKNLTNKASENKTEITNQINDTGKNLTESVKEAQEKNSAQLGQTQKNLSEEGTKNKTEISSQISEVENNLMNNASENKAEISSQISDTGKSLTDNVKEAQEKNSEQLNQTQKSLSDEAGKNKDELSAQLTSEITNAEAKISSQIKKTEKTLSDNTDNAKNEVISQVNQTEKNLSNVMKEAKEQLDSHIVSSGKELSEGISETKTQIQNQITNSEKILSQGLDSGVATLVTNLDSVHADITATRTEIQNILQDMGESDANQLTDIISRFTGVNNKLVEINTAMDNAHGEIKDLIGSLQASSEKNQEELLATLTNIDSSFAQQNTENYELLVNSMQTQTDTVQRWFQSLNSSVTSNFQDLTNTVGNIEQSANANKEEVINNFNLSFTNLSASVGNIGQAVADGKDEIINRISELEIKSTDNYNKISNDLQSVFQSASNGKQLLASALLAKNVSIEKDATFQQIYDAILAIDQQIVIGTEQIPGTITYEYHYHDGDAENGSGCYTKKLYHQHSPECYSKATCTVTVHANGGFFSEGDDWCPCHGNVHKIKQNVIRKHSSCGAADNYGQISFTEHHGPGTDGFHGYDSSTHSYDKLSCGKTNATFEGWDVGCGFVDGQIIGAYIVYDQGAHTASLSSRMATNLRNYIPRVYDDYVWIHNASEKPLEEETESEVMSEEETMIETEIQQETQTETETQMETPSSEPKPETDTDTEENSTENEVTSTEHVSEENSEQEAESEMQNESSQEQEEIPGNTEEDNNTQAHEN